MQIVKKTVYTFACVLTSGAFLSLAADLTVGPGKTYPRIEDAVAKAKAGDSILVHPQADNKPYEKVALYIPAPRLTIKAVTAPGEHIPLSGKDFDYSGAGKTPRAIIQFNKGTDGCTFEGFELSGAHNESHNGAGIRINQANDVVIRNCRIHNNDMGIMSNGDGSPATAANQLIERCLIYSNGDPAEPGYNHNLYLGGTSVTLLGCEIHSSLTGHNVKSRAHRTSVIACYVHDSANREFDLVDGKGDTSAPESDAILAGNIIVKAKNCSGNRAVIHFGQDGGNEHNGTLYLIHNTIVTPFISPVAHLSAPKASAKLINNIVWDGGAGQNGQKLAETRATAAGAQSVSGACNWFSSGFRGPGLDGLALKQTFLADPGAAPPFADTAKGDFHLSRKDSNITDAGQALAEDLMKVVGKRLKQYKSPQSEEDRPAAGKPDLGAYELAPRQGDGK